MKKSLFVILLILALSFSLAIAAESIKRTAVILETKGTVETKSANGIWVPAQTGAILNPEDAIRTAGKSMAILNLDGNGQTATVEVKEKTELELTKMLAEKGGAEKTLLDLSLGNILIKAKKLHSEKSSFEVKTPTSVVAVRGTTFSVSVEAVE